MKKRLGGASRRTSVADLRARLSEAEENLRAIRSGEVDALVVSGRHGDRIFTLEGADYPFRMLIEQMGEGAVTAALDGTVLYANRRFADQCGRPLEQVLGSSLYRFWAPEAAAALKRLVSRCKDEPASGEFALSRPRGPLATRVSVGRLSAYSKPAVMLVVTDLTGKKQREELVAARDKLQRFNAELERRVGERTAELTALNQDLEAFCYSASHDLRAPLRSINGFGDLLQRDLGRRLGKENARRIERIQAATRRMGDVIDGLLSLSRLGRDQVVYEELDLSGLAASIVSDLRRAEPRRKAVVSIARGMKARGDRRLATILLQNLLQNAWKFGRRPRAAIRLYPKMEGGRRAFVVQDDGAGFEAEYAETIFQPFKRLHTSEEYPGTGIGLALARRIAARHGGWIRAEGTPGKGASFTFALASRARPKP